jgi:acyl-CoA thioesterase FadM
MEPKLAFRHDVRVRFVETDAQTVVYHANYLLGTSSMTFEYRIVRGETLVCEVKTVHCAIDRVERTPLPLPEEFKRRGRAFEAGLRAEPLRA